MNTPFCPVPEQRTARSLLAVFLAFATACASAQDATAQVLKELPAVKIHRKHNPGDLPYKNFFNIQSYLQSLMPYGRRVADLQLRVNFASDKGPAYDEFMPKTWAVAVVGESTDQVVPVRRGGYFLLPELPDALHENATLMFNTPTREGRVAMEWMLRLGHRQTLPYADFAKALDDVRAVQRKIPFNRTGLQEVRLVEYDGLRACFLDEGGRIDVNGRPAATITQGKCQVLKFDVALGGAGTSEIAFVGPLDIVTLNGGGL